MATTTRRLVGSLCIIGGGNETAEWLTRERLLAPLPAAGWSRSSTPAQKLGGVPAFAGNCVELLQYRLPILLHSKTIAVDDQIAMIGSSNLNIRSLTLNMEVSLVVDDPAVVAELHKVFDGHIARSKRCEL